MQDVDDSEYLTDYQRYVKTPRINGQWSIVVGNKLLFHNALSQFNEHLPDLYGYLRSGRFHHVDAIGTGTSDATEWILNRLHSNKRLVAKYVKGGGGSRVYILQKVGAGYLINGDLHSKREFIEHVQTLEEYIITEYVSQADYARDLYPETPNSIRVLTMYDEKADEPFFAGQMHRMGTSLSGALDNFSQGGLSAGIDARTGELSQAVQFPYSGERTWYDAHPDTGAQITGTVIPGWNRITDRLIDIAAELSHIPYLGWDLIVTGPGEFRIIEANNHTNTRSIQVHEPLLRNDRVRHFYECHGVI
ncbi:sugar-transfer associated ATP-grasp domain-containing protein [Natronorarus salvus]|uniref:sugar-transfer associated ATP-grasp domain-containing protein n=1 Tax=Natronorarus salvus TaxID=3117733 RepID=UPI002F267F51